MLVFRETGLDDGRHIAFSRQLGSELEINPFFYGRENDRVGVDELWDVSKSVEDDNSAGPCSTIY